MTILPPPAAPPVFPPPTLPPAGVARRSPPAWLGTAGMAVYAVAAWLYLLTFPHGLPLPYLDQSWSAIVTQAAAEHWAFGRQIMLNYGPWAHLGIGFYHPALFTTNYLYQVISKGLLVMLICRVSRPLPPVGRALFLATNLCAGMLEWETLGLLATMYAAWLLSEDRTRAGRFLGGAGVALAAAAALMKTFFIVFGLGAFGCVLVRHVLRGRGSRRSWMEGLAAPGGFLLCLGVDWRLAGQSFADLPAYLRGVFELTDGHSRAMGVDATLPVLGLSLAMLALMGGASIVLLRWGKGTDRWPPAVLLAGGLFMAWKQGFTRADAYHVSGFLWFMAVAVVALPLFFGRRALAPGRHYALIASVWTLATAAMWLARPAQGAYLLHELAARPSRNWSVLWHPAAERARLDAKLAELRAACALPRTCAAVGRTTVDFYGIAPILLVNNGLNYAPVPTLQGFLAYTPYLAGLNAACYDPGRAPEFVLYAGGSIDDRWRSLDGALQLREILCNYRPLFVEATMLLLQRRPPDECVRPRSVLQQRGELPLGTRLELPADGADWCELEVHPTLIGRLLNFFYHEPFLVIEGDFAGNNHGHWTLPPIMAQGGFLLRQGPRSNEDVARLTMGETIRYPMTAFSLSGNTMLRWAIRPQVSYRLYRLDPPRHFDTAATGAGSAVAGGASWTVSRLR